MHFRFLFFQLALLLCLRVIGQEAPPIQWQKALGGSGSDIAQSFQQTSDGGYIVVGTTQSNNGDVSGDHGGRDFWVVKLDASGTFQWQKPLGGSSDDVCQSVAQTDDGGYVVAGNTLSTNGQVTGNHGTVDCWVVKLDADGTLQWQKALGGSSDDFAQSIVRTSDGGYIVVGSSYSTDGDITGNHGSSDCWVVKLDASGTLQWQKALGGSAYEEGWSIQQTVDGGYVMFGLSTSTDGNVSGAHGGMDYWVAKLDDSGELQWQKALGGSGDEIARSIQQTSDGGYVVAGYSNSTDGDVTENHGGENDCWVVKLGINGELQWQKALGGSGNDIAQAIEQTNDGGYVISGGSDSEDGDVTGAHGGYDCWVVKLDGSGELQWQKAMGGSGADAGSSIKQTSDEGFVVAGYSNSMDGDVSGIHGAEDFWVVKLTRDDVSVAEIGSGIGFDLYPNPTSESVNVQLAVTVTGAQPIVQVFDALGHSLPIPHTWSNAASGEGLLTLSLGGLANGVYQVRVQMRGHAVSRTVVKQ